MPLRPSRLGGSILARSRRMTPAPDDNPSGSPYTQSAMTAPTLTLEILSDESGLAQLSMELADYARGVIAEYTLG